MMSPADIGSPIVIYVVLGAEALFDGAWWVVALRAFRIFLLTDAAEIIRGLIVRRLTANAVAARPAAPPRL